MHPRSTSCLRHSRQVDKSVDIQTVLKMKINYAGRSLFRWRRDRLEDAAQGAEDSGEPG